MAATIEIPLSEQARRALRTAAQMCDTSEEEFARTAIESSILNLSFDVPGVDRPSQPPRRSPHPRR